MNGGPYGYGATMMMGPNPWRVPGYGAPGGFGGSTPMPGMPGSGMPPYGAPTTFNPTVPGSSAFSPGGAVKGVGQTLWGGLKGIGQWVQKNPELASDLAGTALSAYGAYKMGQANDRAAALQERRQNLEEEAYNRQQELDAQERERRRRAYQEILAGREKQGG